MRGILGVDPGISGALAIFNPSASAVGGLRWQVIDMPVAGDRPELNATELRDWLRRHEPEHAYIELVNAMPSIGGDKPRRGMGATSAFRFGGIFFALKAVVACCDIPSTMIAPQSWKKAAGIVSRGKCDSTDDVKERSRLRALQLFPDQGELLKRKKDQNRAEAMLIAACGAKLSGR